MSKGLATLAGVILIAGFLVVPRALAAPAEVLVQGAPMAGAANGMFFDLDDNLYVANVFGQSISKLDPETGEILDRLGPAEGVFAADDLTFDSVGTLFWTDPFLGLVMRRDPGGPSSLVADGFPSANPITIGDDGRLFFAQCFDAGPNGIYEADPTGAVVPIPIRTGDPGCASNGMDWWDGVLYSPRWYEGRIVTVDINTGNLTDVTTDWGIPTALKFNSLGELHAVNQGNGELVRIDVATGDREVLAVFPYGWSDNLAFDSNDRLFVSSATEGTVLEVLPDGSLRTVSPGGMTVPMGMALIDGTVYTAEPQTIRGFDARTGDPVSEIRSAAGIGPGLFTTSVSSVGDHLVLMSILTSQLLIWDTKTDSPVLDTFDFILPLDAEPFEGDLLVAELGTGSVVRAELPDLTVRETIASGFIFVAGLAVDDDDAYVSDAVLGTVFQIIRGGEVLAEPLPVATGLAGPEGIALRSGGNRLLVVEGATSSLKEIHLRSGTVKTIATDLGFQPPFLPTLPTHWFNDVEVGSDGAMYVNSDGANVIYKLRSHGNAE
jgi:DNA-binding beta-propeller fold protein YncE